MRLNSFRIPAAIIGLTLLVTPVVTPAPASAETVGGNVPSRAKADKVLVYSANGYGYAGATFNWTGPGQLSDIDLLVTDQKCDSNPVWAYFRVNRTNNTFFTTGTRRYDYSGCDKEDYSTYNDLSLSDGFDIKTVQLIICVRNGSCHTGGESDRNPYLSN